MLEQRVQGLEREVVGLKERLARMEREQGVVTVVRPARDPEPQVPASYAWPEQARSAEAPPAPTPAPVWAVATPKPKPVRVPRPRPTVDLEDLLGGRVLAWLGGAAVAIGLAFLMALAISSGWIGEGARTVIAGAAAAALIGVGIWLHEQRGRTDAAVAALSAGIASMFGVAAVATSVYHLIPIGAGLVMAIVTGALATALAVRWESQGLAALGLLGAMLAPAVGGGYGDGPAVAVLFVAAASAVGVLLSQGWRWLSYGVVLIALPQWVAFLVDNGSTFEIVSTLVAFGALGAVAAIGHEMREGRERLSASAAFLLVGNAIAAGGFGYGFLEEASGSAPAIAWIWSLAAAHVAVAFWASRRDDLARDLGLLLFGAGTVIADVAFALSFQGPARSLGWVLTGVAFAALARHQRAKGVETSLVSIGLGGHLALALTQAVTTDASPELIGNAAAPSLAAMGALVALAAGCFASGRLADDGHGQMRSALNGAALVVLGYLTVITLDGLPLVLALAAEAVALAAISRREQDEIAAWGALGAIALGLGFALEIGPPVALASSLADPLAALAALGAVALACGLTARLVEVERGEFGRVLDALALTVVGYLTLLELDGAVLVAALAAEALLLVAWWRAQDEPLGGMAALVALVFAGGFAIELAPPSALGYGLDEPLAATAALAALIAATAGGALLTPSRELRSWLIGAAGLTALYLASVLVVTPFQPDGAAAQVAVFELPVRQQGQVLLSGLWAVLGLAGLVVGLTRDLRPLRLAALGLLLVAVGKVFTYDLASLDSVYRVASFVALGVLLLVAAFVWQRVRPRELQDMRDAPPGIR